MVFRRERLVYALALLVLVGGRAGAEERRPPDPAVASTAQSVPRLIRFAGIHSRRGHDPAGGETASLTFRLYREQIGGGPLWTETQVVETDELGRYQLFLGATEPRGIPLELFGSQGASWLAIQAGADAEEGSRILLVSVPYALKASDADTLGGKPASAYALAGPPCSPGESGPRDGAAETLAAREGESIPRPRSRPANGGLHPNGVRPLGATGVVDRAPVEAARAGGAVFSVRDFGARGDNQTDDTEAIQAAWNAAAAVNNKAVLFFPAGNYRILRTLHYPTTDIAHGNIVWQGVGRYSSRLMAALADSRPLVAFDAAAATSFVSFHDLSFSNIGRTSAAIVFSGAAGGTDFYFEDVGIYWFSEGIVAASNYTTFRFVRCNFRSMTGPTFRQDAGGSTYFRICTWNQNTGAAIVSVGTGGTHGSLVMTDNIIESSAPVLIGSLSHFVFTGNHCESSRVVAMAPSASGVNQNFFIAGNIFSAVSDDHLPVLEFRRLRNGTLLNNQVNLRGDLKGSFCTVDSDSVDFQESQTIKAGTGTLSGRLVDNRSVGRTRITVLPLSAASSRLGNAVVADRFVTQRYGLFPGTARFAAGARFYLVCSLATSHPAHPAAYRLASPTGEAIYGICQTTEIDAAPGRLVSVELKDLPENETLIAEDQTSTSPAATGTVYSAYIRVEW